VIYFTAPSPRNTEENHEIPESEEPRLKPETFPNINHYTALKEETEKTQ
jgi:hypothetical protein